MLARTLVLALVVSWCAVTTAWGDVRRVPQDHATIQEAVNVAGEGDVIKVRKGTYAEQVVVTGKTGLTIQGQGKVTVDGGGLGPAIRVVGSERVTLQKLVLTGGTDSTLHLLRSTGCVVMKCTVQGVGGRALLVAAGGGHLITKNKLLDNTGANIDLDSDASVNPDGCTVSKNRISGGFVGVELQGTNHVIEKNRVQGTRGFGIQTFQGNDVRIERNKLARLEGEGIRVRSSDVRVVRNSISGTNGDGIYVTSSGTGCLIERNVVKKVGGEGSDGIDTDNPVEGLTVRSNKVIRTDDDGLVLSLTNGVVEGNKVVKAGATGLQVDAETTGSQFAKNKTVKSGSEGLDDRTGGGGGNTFTDNRFDGVDTD